MFLLALSLLLPLSLLSLLSPLRRQGYHFVSLVLSLRALKPLNMEARNRRSNCINNRSNNGRPEEREERRSEGAGESRANDASSHARAGTDVSLPPDAHAELLRRLTELENKVTQPDDGERRRNQGPLTANLYQAIIAPASDLPDVGTFGSARSRFSDPVSFITCFRERLRLFGHPDQVMCRFFPTCLEEIAFEWYASLPSRSIHNFDQLEDAFLG